MKERTEVFGLGLRLGVKGKMVKEVRFRKGQGRI